MSAAASIQGNSQGVALISGELVFSTVRQLSAAGESLLAGSTPLNRLDLRGVTRVDSSGLALLLEWQSKAHAQGMKLTVSNAPEDLARLARLCEAENLLQLKPEAVPES